LKVCRFVHWQHVNAFSDDLNRWLWYKLLGCSLDVDNEPLVPGIGKAVSRSIVPFAWKMRVQVPPHSFLRNCFNTQSSLPGHCDMLNAVPAV
jgi:hypothetical protein